MKTRLETFRLWKDRLYSPQTKPDHPDKTGLQSLFKSQDKTADTLYADGMGLEVYDLQEDMWRSQNAMCNVRG